jgi:type I restriction enzyme M protein
LWIPSRRKPFTTRPAAPAAFLPAAWEHMRKKPLARNAEVYSPMRSRFSGIDIVPEVVRLCAMNLNLHDIAGRDSPIEARDAALGDGGKTYDVVLTNPPFSKKQSYRIVRDDGEIDTERRLPSAGFLRNDLEQAA